IEQSEQFTAQHLHRRQVGQRQQVSLLEALVIQVTKMDFELIKFGAETLDDFSGARNITLAGDHRELAGQSAIELADSGFFSGDAENRVLNDMDLGAGF